MRVERSLHWLVALLAAAGCGLADAPGEPWVEAHRGAAGYWPQNSRTAMLGSLDAGYDAIELDLVLTSDGVPVLAHDPWVHPELCTTASGDPVEEGIAIDGLTLAELQEGYLCGGVLDPDWPDAEVVAEEVMTLDELLEALADHPEVVVHLDVKQDPEWTTTAAAYAEAILERWWAADLDNDWYVTSAVPEVIVAFEDHGDAAGEDVLTSLSWPAFPHGSSSTLIGVGAELGMSLGTTELVYQARQARADGLALPYQMADLRRVRAVRDQGLMVEIWTLNSPALLRRYHKWPVDALITDIPEEAPVIPALLAAAALAGPVSLDRVDLLSEDPGTWLNYELPQLQGATASMQAVRFVAQVKPVWTTPWEGLYVGTSLASQSVVWESALAEGPDLFLTAGVQTRLLLPSGVLMGVAWRGGPVRIGLSLSMVSEATWVRPSWSSWTLLPSLGVGIVRRGRDR